MILKQLASVQIINNIFDFFINFTVIFWLGFLYSNGFTVI